MSKLKRLLQRMEENPANVRFSELCRICELYFGVARQGGTSHRVYKTPWMDDPRINIQEKKGMAKAYQVKQVLAAIERFEDENDHQE